MDQEDISSPISYACTVTALAANAAIPAKNDRQNALLDIFYLSSQLDLNNLQDELYHFTPETAPGDAIEVKATKIPVSAGIFR